MPVRSLSSSVLRWPDKQAVDAAVRAWARLIAQENPDVVAIGYFGSYARGDWGVGSDVDLVMVLKDSELPFERRGVEMDTTELPVPADLLVYTSDEWREVVQLPGGRPISEDAVWVYRAGADG